MTDPFPVVHLRATDAYSEEVMGSKRKGWFRRDGHHRPWLFKYSRQSDGQVVGEHWSEKLGAEFAELIGLPHAQVELACLDGQVGSLSERFPLLEAPNAELEHGNALLARVDDAYAKDVQHGQRQHTFPRIKAAIRSAIHQGDEPWHHLGTYIDHAHTMLAGTLVLDAMILNTDRHHENWGIIRYCDDEGERCFRLTPSFDHASSLARNESADTCARWLADSSLDRAAWYARRAHGAIWLDEGSKKGPSPLDLVVALHCQEQAIFAPWIDQLRAVTPAQIATLVQRVPDAMMPASNKAFVTALVSYTTRTLAALT